AGHTVPARAPTGAPDRARPLLPGRVPAADRGAGFGIPPRPDDRPHALPLQLGEHDHARAWRPRQAGAAVLRDPFRGRPSARNRGPRPRSARLPAGRTRRPAALAGAGVHRPRLGSAAPRASARVVVLATPLGTRASD